MKTCILLFFFTLLIVNGCRQTPELSEAQRATVTTEVQLALHATADSVQANGLIGWLPFLDKSPDFNWQFRNVGTPYDTLVDQIKHVSPQNRSVNLSWDSIQVEPKSLTEAWITVKYKETFVDFSGKQSPASGMIKAQMHKVADSWKFRKVNTQPD